MPTDNINNFIMSGFIKVLVLSVMLFFFFLNMPFFCWNSFSFSRFNEWSKFRLIILILKYVYVLNLPFCFFCICFLLTTLLISFFSVLIINLLRNTNSCNTMKWINNFNTYDFGELISVFTKWSKNNSVIKTSLLFKDLWVGLSSYFNMNLAV